MQTYTINDKQYAARSMAQAMYAHTAYLTKRKMLQREKLKAAVKAARTQPYYNREEA